MDREPVLIDLALQGGGSHGAFTWGVLAKMRTHRSESDMLAQFGASSLNGEWDFLDMLRAEGRRAAGEFLEVSCNDLSKRSNANLDVLLAEC